MNWQPIARIGQAVLRRRKRLVVVTFAAAVVLLGPAAYFLSKEAPRYRAAAVVLLEARPDGPQIFRDHSPLRPLPVQLAILESRALAEGVLESLPKNAVRDLIDHPFSVDLVSTLHNTYLRLWGLDPEVPNPSRAALRELRSRVKFAPSRDGIVEIAAEASEPQIAVDIANTYIEVLLSRTRSFNIDDARTSREFLERQLAEVKKNLRSSEDTLRAFNATNGGVKVPEQSQVTLARLGQIEASLAEVESSRKMLQTRVQGLRDKAETQKRQPPTSPSVVTPPVVVPAEIQRIRNQLAQLETALINLREKFTDQHPRVVLIKERIAEAQRQLGDAVKETAPPTSASPAIPPDERVNFAEQLVALETAYHSVVAQEDALRRQADGLRQSLSGLGRSELEYSRHVREVDSNRNLHTILADNLTAARIREQGEMKVVKVIDPPSYPVPTASEKQLRLLALAFLGALGIGAAVPAAVEWLHRTVDSEEDVENATGLAVLAVLPRLRSRPIRFFSTAETARLKEADENFMFSEALRNLRVTIQLAGRTAVPRSILVTSPSPAEGKSTLVVNLGMAFGEAGYRVVLADTDFQRPTLHRILKVAPSAPGLTNALETEDKIGDALVPVGDRLWMAPRGSSFQPQARGMLATKRLKTLVEDMSERADMVLCDSSPVLLIPDNLFLAGAVDGVILVARSGVTTYRDLAQTKALLESAGAHLLGVVLNEVPPASLRRHYTKYYRAYVKKEA